MKTDTTQTSVNSFATEEDLKLPKAQEIVVI